MTFARTLASAATDPWAFLNPWGVSQMIHPADERQLQLRMTNVNSQLDEQGQAI